MTAPHYGVAVGSRVVVTMDQDEVHVWRHPESSTIALNIEEHEDTDNAQDVIAPLTAPQARELADVLITAAQELEDAEAETAKAKEAELAAEKLRNRLQAAPQVGDLVLIAADPSPTCPEERGSAHRTVTMTAARFGGRWGEVKMVNYDDSATTHHFPLGPSGADMRAWVTVADADGERSAWLHVDYLTPAAPMARTRAD